MYVSTYMYIHTCMYVQRTFFLFCAISWGSFILFNDLFDGGFINDDDEDDDEDDDVVSIEWLRST